MLSDLPKFRRTGDAAPKLKQAICYWGSLWGTPALEVMEPVADSPAFLVAMPMEEFGFIKIVHNTFFSSKTDGSDLRVVWRKGTTELWLTPRNV